jgi:hypothetical protein
MTFNYADYFERRADLCGGALVVRALACRCDLPVPPLPAIAA